MHKWWLLGCVALVAGCSSNKTETGYQYRPLSDSPTVMRSYYAPAFTPAAQAAANDQAETLKARRPTAGRP